MGGETTRGLIGIAVFVALAWGLSENRRAFAWRTIGVGLAVQIGLALLLTKVPAITAAFGALAHGVDGLQKAAVAGTGFVFGYLAGGPSPFVKAVPEASSFIFAFQALPAILLVGALSALLWHWGILRWVVRGAAWLFGRAFGVSGPVGVSTSACIFLGMIEAPLLIRPLVPKLSRGELFILMVDGLSVIGGSMMIVIGALVAPRLPGAFAHVLTATLISTPMAIAMARAIIPTGPPTEDGPIALERHHGSALEAITQGTLAAARLAFNIAALLIVFIALIALVNMALALIPTGGTPLSLGAIFGWLLAPVAWAMGVPQADIATAASLLGTKLALNEVVAFGQLVALPAGALAPKTILILTYALASFGNIGSVAILIGAITGMAPERSKEAAELGLRALAAAFLTTCLSATIVGLLDSLF
jgi:CNT family concentrative nucleoside transporter